MPMERSLAATSTGVVAVQSMLGILQTAKSNASGKVCNLREDYFWPLPQTANMDATEDQTANNLRAWREHRKMTQEDLAAAVGTSGSVISLLESGDRKLSTKWLHRLAPALRVQAGFLVDYDPTRIDTSTLEMIETVSQIAMADRPRAIEMLKVFTRTGTGG
jgi:transcriptional regulator with XRE-family HTH domain